MKTVEEIIKAQEDFRRGTIALQPSENTIPRKALKALSSDFEQRYSLVIDSKYRNSTIHNAYAGTNNSEILVETVERLAMSTFKKEFADVRPISGHLAAMQVVGNLLKAGERFLYIPVDKGGYDGYSDPYLPLLFRIKGREIPMKGWEIDYEKMEKLSGSYSAVILGASIFLHPYNLKRIKESFPDSLILYDASHVLGLLANGEFQRDLVLADVIYGSTHKNFPGPQGGIIVGKRKFEENVRAGSIWKYYDNFHLGRIASLGISLEYLHSNPYGKSCVENTRSLVKDLRERLIRLANLPKVTESAMFLLDYENVSVISERMESAGILIDRIGRIGLNEVTMRGLKPAHMNLLSEAIEDVMKNRIPEARNTIKSLLAEMTWP